MNPKITVIIPVYKVEQYLCQCLDSVVNQTYRNLEIIIIDDGSPDHCPAICDEYAGKDSRIQVIHKKNGGLSAARNDGIKRASGEWVTFVDSDDWCELDYYEQLISVLEDKEVDVFCAGGRCVERSNESTWRKNFDEPFLYMERKDIDYLMARVVLPPSNVTGLADMGAPWDKLYRTTFLRLYGLEFDVSNKAWEDNWFNLQVMDRARGIAGCTYIGYHYRMVQTSITKGFNPDKPAINYGFIQNVYNYLEGREISPQMQSAINFRCLRLILNAFQCCYFHPSNQASYRETAQEIKDMKQWPYFHDSIWQHSNDGLSKKQIVLKMALRLPWIWPVKMLFDARQRYL